VDSIYKFFSIFLPSVIIAMATCALVIGTLVVTAGFYVRRALIPGAPSRFSFFVFSSRFVICFLLLFGDLFSSSILRSLAGWYIWVHWANPTKYYFEGLMTNQFATGIAGNCTMLNATMKVYASGLILIIC
jgi:hypothetical protein